VPAVLLGPCRRWPCDPHRGCSGGSAEAAQRREQGAPRESL